MNTRDLLKKLSKSINIALLLALVEIFLFQHTAYSLPCSTILRPPLCFSVEAGVSEKKILKHWNKIRAARPGLQSVMSKRHTEEQNIKATIELQRDILKLGDVRNAIQDKSVFELGVGIGRMTSWLAKYAKKVSGNDISERMINRAEKALRAFNNIELFTGKITGLNLNPKSFDLVFTCTVLGHIPNPEELKETIKTMKKISNNILIVEHIRQEGFSPTKFTVTRTPQEYMELFKPYKLVIEKDHLCIDDKYAIMLFKNPEFSGVETGHDKKLSRATIMASL
jgi:2-polyprenyl-3-methyl-5-hydroxy-6-metoxy-1,4-benzoquinol methylase